MTKILDGSEPKAGQGKGGVMLTEYDKARLRKWADSLAIDRMNAGHNINPFRYAANAMIRDAAAVARDLGGGVTAAQVRWFFGPKGPYK